MENPVFVKSVRCAIPHVCVMCYLVLNVLDDTEDKNFQNSFIFITAAVHMFYHVICTIKTLKLSSKVQIKALEGFRS